MSMKEFHSWAGQYQDKYNNRINNVLGVQPRFNVTSNPQRTHDTGSESFNKKAAEFLTFNINDKKNNSVNEQDQYDRLVNATPEQRARLRELDRKQQARESDPITGKYSTALRTGGLDAAIGALEDDGRQARVGQMRTDIASGELKPRAATQAATQAAAPATQASQTDTDNPLAPNPPGTGTVLREPEKPVGTGTVLRDPSQVEMPDTLQNIGRPMVKNPEGGLMPAPPTQSPNVGQSAQDFFDNFGKPMVKNPAGGMMPDPKFAQSPIDAAPEEKKPTFKDYFEKGKEEGIAQAGRDFTGGVTITKGGRSTIPMKQGVLGTQSSLARGPRDLTKRIKSTATQARSSAAQAGRPPSAANMMAGASNTSSAIAKALSQKYV